MAKLLKGKNFKRLLLIIVFAVIVALAIYLIFNGKNYFSRRSIRLLQREIRSFGILSPLVVASLISLSTIIPPLPLPIPLVEIAGGLVFGLWGGFLVTWVSQTTSSLLAFELSRYFGRRFFGNILNNRIWDFYKQYLHKKGPIAVLITRATFAAPFNIISFLAGLTQMKITSFLAATALGTIPESILFPFIGSRLRSIHINLWYLFILTIVLGLLGSLITFLIMRFLQPRLKA